MPRRPVHFRRPLALVVAASVVALQGLVLGAVGIAALLDLVGDRLEVGLSTAVFFLAYAALLLGAARALTLGSGWARGPALITQLIGVGLAYNLREEPWLAGALALVSAVGLAALAHPESIEALGGDLDRPDGPHVPD